ncbi:hypothetical protein KAW50_03570 [candidate division WOR-3 bacterium]|nr:hypothetical protein [candidate division WOR-3 bacterium]
MTSEEILKKAIEKAVKNGYRKELVGAYKEAKRKKLKNYEVIEPIGLIYRDTFECGYYALIFFHDFAKALWGERRWEIPLSKIKHEWEVDHYQADSAKTPVYRCKKHCTASKINNVIYYDQEDTGKTDNIKLAGYIGILASSHNIRLLQGWKDHLQELVLEKEPLKYLEKFLKQ